jgi:hypothetical protein
LGELPEESPVLKPSPKLPGQGKGRDPGVFYDFIEALHGYCQKHFLPLAYSEIDITHLTTNIYGVSGTCFEKENTIGVSLNAEKRSGYYKDLEYAVKRVNERRILDYSGRRLWLDVEPHGAFSIGGSG